MSSVLDRTEAEGLYRRFTAKITAATAEIDQLKRDLSGMERMVDGLQQMYPDLGQNQEPDTTASAADARQPLAPEVSVFPVIDDASTALRPVNLSSVEIAAKVVEDMATESAVSVLTVYAEMKRRGWLPRATDPLAAVRTALSRARQQGLLVSVALDGRSNGYMLPRNTSGPDSESGPEVAVPGATRWGGGDDVAPGHDDPDHDQAGRNRDRGGDPAVVGATS